MTDAGCVAGTCCQTGAGSAADGGATLEGVTSLPADGEGLARALGSSGPWSGPRREDSEERDQPSARKHRPARCASPHRHRDQATPKHRPLCSSCPPCPAVDAVSVLAWLRAHPDVLEKHVMDELELETLERWIIRKTQRAKKQAQAGAGEWRCTSM